jgi:hypothetical protein
MDAVVFTISPDEYVALSRGKGARVEALEAGAKRKVRLDDDWAAVTLLLTGRLLSTVDPDDEVLVGSELLDDFTRGVPHTHVSRIARELEALDEATVARRLDGLLDELADDLERQFGGQPKDGRDTLERLASEIRGLYASAACAGDAVLVRSPLLGVRKRAAPGRRPRRPARR